MADLTFKAAGDAQLGRVYQPNSTDIIPLLRDPYTGAGKDGYIQWQDMVQGEPVYNALTDGGIVADYVDRLNPGTDQRADIVTWIKTVGLPAGKKNFFFPPGHYLVGQGDGTATQVIDINGYDDVRIFGIPGKTFFHTAQGMDLKYKFIPLFRFGWTQTTKRSVVEGITFINDPYVTDSEESDVDGDIYWGWKYYEPWRASQVYETGDYKVSTDDNWLIHYTSGGTSAGTEPTWSAGTTADGTATVVVVALNNWAALTAYTAGTHVKTTTAQNYHGTIGATTRSIMWASNTGTSGAAEAELALPSAEGTFPDNDWQWIAAGNFASQSTIRNCEFIGLAGFRDAGGTCFGFSGSGGGLVEDCYFHDFQYGGVVSGYYDNWTFLRCRHERIGGWGFAWASFNAHSYYTQGGRNLWHDCSFDRHFMGLDIKIHGNVTQQDSWQNRIVNCRFSNYGWGSIEFVGGVSISDETTGDGPDFVLAATSGDAQSAKLQKVGLVSGCTFRVHKSAYDDWDWRRPASRPNNLGKGAVYVQIPGVKIIGCDFIDTYGVQTSVENPWIGTHTPTMVSVCSFQTIFRDASPFDGTISADNCQFDYRATLGIEVGVNLTSYSRLTNSSIIGSTTATGNAGYGLLKLAGPHVKVDNCQIILTGAGHPVSWGEGSGGAAHVQVSMTNCVVNAPSGTIYAYPRGDSAYWRFANNYWNISGWDSRRLTNANHETWVWENERGNLFNSIWDATKLAYNSGIIRMIPIAARSFTSAGTLVDSTSTPTANPAGIYGVELEANDVSPYKAWVAVSANANHWILCSELVAKGDWLTMSATAGQLAPNGTSGSTTRPTSGIQARVIDAGTASAGAGRAHVEVFEWNRPDPTGGSVVPYSGTSDPGVNDDNTQGHVAGITGINTTTGDMFICLDATTGAAVWQAL